MTSDLLSEALRRSEGRNLSVLDLIRVAEELKGLGDVPGVLRLYRSWIDCNGDNPLLYAVLFNMAVAMTDAGEFEAARECLEQAASISPAFMPAHINLGRIYERQGNAAAAVMQWSTVSEGLAAIDGTGITHKTTALNQIARVLEERNQHEPAESALRRSVEIDPRQREAVQHYLALRQRQCKWPVIVPWDRVDRETLTAGFSPLSIAAHTDDPMLHLAAAWHYNKTDVGDPVEGAMPSHWATRERRGGGRLRIGYLSSDLREHAVGYLTAELFELHDRNVVELFVYYCGPAADDPLHQRIKAASEHWIAISDMDDAAAARRIADDGVQILVDLNGYSRDARSKLLALRPAPIIVNWLGYPGTAGSPYHHYLIADEGIVPTEHEIYYSEKVLRLPCYQPNDRRRIVAPQRPTREDVGLPRDAMVYCCFNGLHKISRFAFERWTTILQRVPDSVLWLLADDDATEERLRDFAHARGVARDRLIFAEKKANPDHLARYPLADLFLDTAPYGAHTTASDALWMGVPMLTLTGRAFASRVCTSLVRAAGVPELACGSPEEYVDRAVAMGRDRTLSATYRERLIAQRDSCDLFNTPMLVTQLEALFAEMWADLKAGQLPQPDLANLDVYFDIGVAIDHEAVEVGAIADYTAWWQGKLMQRHRIRPIPADRRLWRDRDLSR